MVDRIKTESLENTSVTGDKTAFECNTFDPEPITGYDVGFLVQHARISKKNKEVDFSLCLSGAISTTPSEITFTLPETPSPAILGQKAITCYISEDGGTTFSIGVCILTNSATINIKPNGGGTFNNTANTIVTCSGKFEVS